jgi:hypothetical protein
MLSKGMRIYPWAERHNPPFSIPGSPKVRLRFLRAAKCSRVICGQFQSHIARVRRYHLSETSRHGTISEVDAVSLAKFRYDQPHSFPQRDVRGRFARQTGYVIACCPPATGFVVPPIDHGYMTRSETFLGDKNAKALPSVPFGFRLREQIRPGLGGRQVAAGRVQDQPAMGDSGGNRRRGFPQSCP